MQIPLPLDIGRVRLPAANATLLAFTGGTALGACIMWLAGVLPPPPSLTGSGVTLASRVIAPGPPANDHTATGHSATLVTQRVGGQEEAPSFVSSPVAVIPTAITVTSAPAGARVTVDGIGWGGTPVTIRHLPPGQKVIRVTKDGYESQQQTISVADDHRSAAIRVTLRARKLGRSELRLSTDPPVLQTGTPESAKNPGT